MLVAMGARSDDGSPVDLLEVYLHQELPTFIPSDVTLFLRGIP